jgi:cell division protein ZapA (FtsZ GTPase activity inhibitor)
LQSISVLISGVEYNLLGENPAMIYEAAKIVNEKMLKIGQQSVVESSTTNAVLTALNVTEEHLLEQKNNDNELKIVKSSLEEINNILLDVLTR